MFDTPQSFDYIVKAVNLGERAALINLGQFYEAGIGFEKNLKQAETLYINAAHHGLEGALLYLFDLYQDWGKELGRTPMQAVATISRLMFEINSRDPVVVFRMAKLLCDPSLDEFHHRKGLCALHKLAVNTQDGLANLELAKHLMNGIIIKQNYREALFFLNAAKRLGVKEVSSVNVTLCTDKVREEEEFFKSQIKTRIKHLSKKAQQFLLINKTLIPEDSINVGWNYGAIEVSLLNFCIVKKREDVAFELLSCPDIEVNKFNYSVEGGYRISPLNYLVLTATNCPRRLDLAQRMIELGAVVNDVPFDENTLISELMEALATELYEHAQKKKKQVLEMGLKLLELLLKSKADPNRRNLDETTAIFRATKLGKYAKPVMELLIRYGADLDITRRDTGCTVLHYTVLDRNCPASVVRNLIALGAKVDEKDLAGRTARNGIAEIFDREPDRQKDLNLLEKLRALKLAEILFQSAEDGNTERLNSCLAVYPEFINIRNTKGRLLDCAIANQSNPVVRQLLLRDSRCKPENDSYLLNEGISVKNFKELNTLLQKFLFNQKPIQNLNQIQFQYVDEELSLNQASLKKTIYSFKPGFQDRIMDALIKKFVEEGKVDKNYVAQCFVQESIESLERSKNTEIQKLEKRINVSEQKMALGKSFCAIIDEIMKINKEITELKQMWTEQQSIIDSILKLPETLEQYLSNYSSLPSKLQRAAEKTLRFLNDTVAEINRNRNIPETVSKMEVELKNRLTKLNDKIKALTLKEVEIEDQYVTDSFSLLHSLRTKYKEFPAELPAIEKECKVQLGALKQQIKEALKASDKEADSETHREERGTLKQKKSKSEKQKPEPKKDELYGGRQARQEHFQKIQKAAQEAKAEREARAERVASQDRIHENGIDAQADRAILNLFDSRRAADRTLERVTQVTGKLFFADNLKMLERILKNSAFKQDGKKNHIHFKAERNAFLGAFGQMIEIMKHIFNKNTAIIEFFDHVRNVIFHSTKLFPAILLTSNLKDVQKVNERIRDMVASTLSFLNLIKNNLEMVPADKDKLLLDIGSELLYIMDSHSIPSSDVKISMEQIKAAEQDLKEYDKIPETPDALDVMDMARGFSTTQIGTYASDIKKHDISYFNKNLRGLKISGQSIEWFIEQGKDFRHIRKMDLQQQSVGHGSSAAKKTKAKERKNTKFT